VARDSDAAENWAAIAEGVAAGDREAFLELSRLVAGYLARLRAYDFQDEWPDLIQETVLATTRAQQEGRIRDRRAVMSFVWQITRHKFLDRLARKQRRVETRPASLEELPWEQLDFPPHPGLAYERVVDVRRALEKLPENRRRAVFQIYGEGRTYPEAAAALGVPLGTFKRHLREGLRELREIFLADRDAPRSDSRRNGDL